MTSIGGNSCSILVDAAWSFTVNTSIQLGRGLRLFFKSFQSSLAQGARWGKLLLRTQRARFDRLSSIWHGRGFANPAVGYRWWLLLRPCCRVRSRSLGFLRSCNVSSNVLFVLYLNFFLSRGNWHRFFDITLGRPLLRVSDALLYWLMLRLLFTCKFSFCTTSYAFLTRNRRDDLLARCWHHFFDSFKLCFLEISWTHGAHIHCIWIVHQVEAFRMTW